MRRKPQDKVSAVRGARSLRQARADKGVSLKHAPPFSAQKASNRKNSYPHIKPGPALLKTKLGEVPVFILQVHKKTVQLMPQGDPFLHDAGYICSDQKPRWAPKRALIQ